MQLTETKEINSKFIHERKDYELNLRIVQMKCDELNLKHEELQQIKLIKYEFRIENAILEEALHSI